MRLVIPPCCPQLLWRQAKASERRCLRPLRLGWGRWAQQWPARVLCQQVTRSVMLALAMLARCLLQACCLLLAM